MKKLFLLSVITILFVGFINQAIAQVGNPEIDYQFSNLPPGIVDQVYPQQTLQVAGGLFPYGCAVTRT